MKIHALLKCVTAMLCLTISAVSWSIELGSTLTPIQIDDKGELVLKEKQLNYAPWHSEQLTGKVHTIQHIAGRSSAKEINQPFMDALKAAQFNRAHYQTTTIINLNDALFGTKSLVTKKSEAKKQEFPHAGFVLDLNGTTLDAWALKQKGSAIIITNKQGEVIYFKDGKMEQEDIEQAIKLIETELNAAIQTTKAFTMLANR